jgi:threonine dehydratase
MPSPSPSTPAATDAPIRPTTVIGAPRLISRLGIDVTIASEAFQQTGSFKFRAAYNVASRVPQQMIITASSGNFGQAIARACALLGKSCIIVMPDTSAKVKIDAVREYGGTVDLVDVAQKSRAQRVAELAAQYPDAYLASPYDDPLVIEGNASLGREIADSSRAFDCIVAPIGGGGLTSGIIAGVEASGKRIEVIAAEPLLANDAARSLRAGAIIASEREMPTIADGARTLSVGKANWPILQRGLAGIVEVDEAQIALGVRLLFELANLKVEPTGALSIGALLTDPERFRGRSVCCVASGGNVDPAVYRGLLAD